MEALFSTSLAINNRHVHYRVIFDHDKYVFLSDEKQPEPTSFSFRREHDEWLDEKKLPPEVKQQAIDALDKYLMKQH
jgi:hypothetical protein